MLRSLTANLIAHERIETTDAKAKELRRVAEKVITKARRLGEIDYTPQDKLSLADRARRHAAQKEVALPHRENFPYSLLEAMVAGQCVIASAVVRGT